MSWWIRGGTAAVEVLFVADTFVTGTGDSYAAEAVLGEAAFESKEALLKARREGRGPCAK